MRRHLPAQLLHSSYRTPSVPSRCPWHCTEDNDDAQAARSAPDDSAGQVTVGNFELNFDTVVLREEREREEGGPFFKGEIK